MPFEHLNENSRNAATGAARRRAAAELLSHPKPPSLRAIARTVGLSVTTVSDVRRRLERGEDPVPPRYSDRLRPSVIRDDARTAGVLRSLSRDPSLRDQEAGRRLLRLLHRHAITVDTADAAGDQVPAHCAGAVATLARAWAVIWLGLARRLDPRGDQE
jgi:hypothetical protein